MMRADTTALAAVLTATLLLPTVAHAQRESGVQITPDTKRVLISKDVSGQRWAITRNLDDGTVTGNVYLPDGGEPTFLFCSQTSSTVEEIVLSCYGAPACVAAPCGGPQFSFIADVTLPQSFFAPPGGAPGSDVANALASALSTATPSGGTRASGLQITPDTLRILISKDVGGQRWAITRNGDDGTVTGNVYLPEGGDPTFLFCTVNGPITEVIPLACSGAGRCEAAPCSPEQFAFIANVELPVSFFSPPDGPTPSPTPNASCGNGVIDSVLEECDGADLGEIDCTEATQSFEDCTGTLTCTSSCKLDVSQCNCPCIGDIDCGVPIDCSAFIPQCQLPGACEGGSCVTSSTGTQQICEGVDPEDPEFPRADACELP